MNNQPIKFRVGEENGIVVEEKDYVNSLFYDQYKAAFSLFQQIWDKQEDMTDGYGVDNQFSNIIAFCGDRGEGKSSCMSSFAKMLADKKCREHAEEAGIIDKGSLPIDKIALVDTIDPAFFDREHNVLELLVGQLFANIKEDIKKMDNNPDGFKDDKSYLYKQLLDQFHKVKASMSILEKKDKLYDTLEEIDDLSAGIRLKKELDELFKLYLLYHQGKASDQLGRIVIRIDDIDLNMTEAYKMAELIRKYLIGKHCILLVAVKVAQLVEVVAGAMKAELKDTAISEVYCHEMAQKYVTKLLPQGNRVLMPDLRTQLDMYVQVEYIKDQALSTDEGMIKDLVVEQIFKKTRYLFFNSKGNASMIIPTNLRRLRHLVGMLWNMPQDNRSVNQRRFKQYFYTEWTQDIDAQYHNFIQNLITYPNISGINKYVLQNLTLIQKNKDERVLEISKYQAYNVSVGDVLDLAYRMECETSDESLLRLLFFIKSYYSIHLYESYDAITEKLDAIYPTNNTTSSIYKADSWFENTNVLQRFVNGSMFTHLPGELLPSENDVARDLRYIDAKQLSSLFAEIKDNENKVPEILNEDEAKAELGMTADKINEEFLFRQKVRRCEFFILTTLCARPANQRNAEPQINKNDIYPYYLAPFNGNQTRLLFDVLAPFANIINLRYAYSKFQRITEQFGGKGFDFYNFAKERNWTLLHWLLTTPKTENSDIKEIDESSYTPLNEDEFHNWWHMLSGAVIRNTEIHFALMDEMRKFRQQGKQGGENIDHIAKLYSNIYTAHMETQKNEDGNTYLIEFAFLRVLATFLRLEKLVPQDESAILFNKIFVIQDPKAVLKNKIIKIIGAARNKDSVLSKLRANFPKVEALKDRKLCAELIPEAKIASKEEFAQTLIDKYGSQFSQE